MEEQGCSWVLVFPGFFRGSGRWGTWNRARPLGCGGGGGSPLVSYVKTVAHTVLHVQPHRRVGSGPGCGVQETLDRYLACICRPLGAQSRANSRGPSPPPRLALSLDTSRLDAPLRVLVQIIHMYKWPWASLPTKSRVILPSFLPTTPALSL